MGVGWFFKRQPPGFRDRNPIQNEFFASESVGSLVSGMIREGLQNSGDAKSNLLSAADPVRIRIFVSGEREQLPSDKIEFWGVGLWDQVSASDSGLRRAPSREEPCRFVVFEDFGTTGLIGEMIKDDPTKEPFYCFFRAENTSSKDSDSGGSWGIGKTVFPRASRANAFFALSGRETDNQNVLMGSLTLRTRHVAGVKYTPDSWFGVPQVGEGVTDGGVIQPVSDTEILQRFCEDFNLSRKLDGESKDRIGTSIVVPWCDDSLTREAIAKAIIQSNFHPIIAGKFVIEICDGDSGETTLLDASTIEDAISVFGGEETAVLLESIRLAIWATKEGEAARVAAVHEPSGHSVKWGQYSLPDSERDRLRLLYDEGKPIAIRAPVPMKKKGGGIKTSHLDIYLKRTAELTTVKPVFVRGSVVIPDHKIRKVPGAVGLIRSNSDELAALLRAAEDPGHKEWSTETDNFHIVKERFSYAKSYLTLARDAAIGIARLLQDDESEEDFDILGDVFSLPKDPEEGGPSGGGAGRKKRKRKKKVVIVKPVAKPVLSVARVSGGFSVSRAAPDSRIPAIIRVRAAYDVRKGNPFKKWDSADFEIGEAPVEISSVNGLKVEKIDGNRIVLKVIDADFGLTVRGFDTSRGDLILDIRPEGSFDATKV